MRELLNALYRECSVMSITDRNQSHALASAAYVLGSQGTPAARLSAAFSDLQVAFRK
jgi:hypothetical protein